MPFLLSPPSLDLGKEGIVQEIDQESEGNDHVLMTGRDLDPEIDEEVVQEIEREVVHVQETEGEGLIPGIGVGVVPEIEDVEVEGVAPMIEGGMNEKDHDPGIVHEIGRNAEGLDHGREEVVPGHILEIEGADISILMQLTISSRIKPLQ